MTHPFRPHRPRPWSPLFAAALWVALFAAMGCDSVVGPRQVPGTAALGSSAVRPPRPMPPKFVSSTPTYPAAVIYILYREYLHKHPGLTRLSPEDEHYQQYLERRLRQLYPARGYSGMVRDAVQEMKQNRLAWRDYQQKQDAWVQSIAPFCNDGYDPNTGEPCPTIDTSDPAVDSSWDGQEEHAVPPDEMIPTLQMEIDTLQMTQPEIDHLYYQESLATGTFFTRTDEVIVTSTGAKATLDDLIRAAGEGWAPPGTAPGQGEVVIQVNPTVIAAVVVSAGIIGWKAYRVVQAAQRSREKSLEYFGTLDYSSTKRDAMRHIFWNMQMRRHVGSFFAKLVADFHEDQGNNSPADKSMDYHNNDIGREVKYRNFRGHWLWDRWDWKEWAVKVRDYVRYAPNGEYIPEWDSNPPTTFFDAQGREVAVPEWKYIYFVQ